MSRDIDRGRDVDGRRDIDGGVRRGSAAVLMGLLALVLLAVPPLALPLGLGAIWLGIRALRAETGTGAAITGIVIGALVVLIAASIGVFGLAVDRLADTVGPEVLAEAQSELEPELLAAAEEVYPCEGRVDDVALRRLLTGHPDLGGRDALTLGEAALAEVDVRIAGQAHRVQMVRIDERWQVNGRAGMTAACEALAMST